MADEIVGIHLQIEGGGEAVKTVGELRQALKDSAAEAENIKKNYGAASDEAKFAAAVVAKVKEELEKASAAAGGLDPALKKVDAPMKSFRAQLREAVQHLVQMQTEFGDISPEAQEAAKAVADLRDRLKDANEVASLFDQEKKFQAVVGVAQGIASGFAAAQGAIALFGGESKEVEKALLKVQSAMALAQGLSGVKASVEDFKRLWAVLRNINIVQKANAVANIAAAATMRLFGVATTQTGVAFNVLKGVIISSGIGLLVVLLGTVVSKIMDWTASTDSQEAAQKRLNDALDNSNALLERNQKAIDYDTKLGVERAKLAGKTQDQIDEIEGRGRLRELEELRLDNNRKYDLYQKSLTDYRLTEEDKKKVRDDATKAKQAYDDKIRANEVANVTVAARDAQTARDEAKKAADKAEQERKAAADKARTQREIELKKISELEKQFADKVFAATHGAEEEELRAAALKYIHLKELYEKYGRDTANLTADFASEIQGIQDTHAKTRADKLAETQQKESEADIKANQEAAARAQERVTAEAETVSLIVDNQKLGFDTRRSLLEEEHQAALVAAAENGRSITDVEQHFSDARKAIAHEERDTKIRAGQAVSGALDSFAQLAGEQTAAGKAFAVASATIQAILGAQQAFTSLSSIPIVGPALGVVAAAGAIATGFANVRKILAVQVPGGGSAGGGSAPSLGGSAPLSPTAPQAQPVQLNQQSINDMGNATVKTIVVESDITTTQNRISRIQQAATFR